MSDENSKSQMYRVDRLDQLRALASPTRLQLVATMHNLGMCSTREIAEQMGKAPDSLHYHLRRLVALGLVENVGKRKTGHRMETVYRLPGKDLEIDLAGRSENYLALVGEVYGAAFRFADRSMTKSLLASHRASEGDFSEQGLVQLSFRMQESAMVQLQERIEGLKAFVAEHEDPKSEFTYLLTIAHNQQPRP